MKRLSMILLALLMAIVMVGCGSGEKAAEETVTVSLPRELLGSQSDEEIIANGEEEDMEVAIKETENGTRVVYTMSKETQDALLLAYKNHFEETLSQEMWQASRRRRRHLHRRYERIQSACRPRHLRTKYVSNGHEFVLCNRHHLPILQRR